MVDRIERRHVRRITEHDRLIAALAIGVPQPAVRWRAAEQSDPTAQEGGTIAREIVVDAEAGGPRCVAAGEPCGVEAERGAQRRIGRDGVGEKWKVEAQADGQREPCGRQPPILRVEAQARGVEIDSGGPGRVPEPLVVVVRKSTCKRVEIAKKPSPGRHLHHGIAEPEELALRAERHEVPSHAEGQIFRDVEGVLIHGHGRAHAVRPGHQGASADADLDQRERRVRST